MKFLTTTALICIACFSFACSSPQAPSDESWTATASAAPAVLASTQAAPPEDHASFCEATKEAFLAVAQRDQLMEKSCQVAAFTSIRASHMAGEVAVNFCNELVTDCVSAEPIRMAALLCPQQDAFEACELPKSVIQTCYSSLIDATSAAMAPIEVVSCEVLITLEGMDAMESARKSFSASDFRNLITQEGMGAMESHMEAFQAAAARNPADFDGCGAVMETCPTLLQ